MGDRVKVLLLDGIATFDELFAQPLHLHYIDLLMGSNGLRRRNSLQLSDW
jgi:hypothetical protein